MAKLIETTIVRAFNHGNATRRLIGSGLYDNPWSPESTAEIVADATPRGYTPAWNAEETARIVQGYVNGSTIG